MHGTPLTRRLRAASNRLGFPVLLIAYEVPFVALAHAVSQANQQREQARLHRVLRLYDRLRAATADQQHPAKLFARLSDDLRCGIYLIDLRTWEPALPDCPALPQRVARPALLQLDAADTLPPTGLRFRVGERLALLLPIPSAVSAALVLLPRPEQPAPDLLVFQHVAAIAALEVEKARADRDRASQRGSELFARLLEGSLDPDTALRLLGDYGFEHGPFVLAASVGPPGSPSQLHQRLSHLRSPSVHLAGDDESLVLLPFGDDILADLEAQAGDDVTIGLSMPFYQLANLTDSCQEARWALRAAQNGRRRVVRYDDSADLPPFFPRTLGEARRVADDVLGPLHDYDREHGTEFVQSLRVFLEQNRAWQATSKLLHVHKQTLIYRMRRVEEITGRSLGHTDDVATLWLALEADELVNGTERRRLLTRV
jgi:purine catabolism regulator